jgi:hypothetical protein
MWILHFLPDALILWFCNIVLFAGAMLTVAGFFIHKIPFPIIYQYQLLFKIVGIVLLVLGVHFRGGREIEMSWRERVAEVEARLAEAEAKSTKANEKIVEKVVKKTEYITRRGQDVIQYVDREIVKYDVKFAPGGACEIPQEFVKAHNTAAEVPKK